MLNDGARVMVRTQIAFTAEAQAALDALVKANIYDDIDVTSYGIK